MTSGTKRDGHKKNAGIRKSGNKKFRELGGTTVSDSGKNPWPLILLISLNFYIFKYKTKENGSVIHDFRKFNEQEYISFFIFIVMPVMPR